jgi:hypothetical protein
MVRSQSSGSSSFRLELLNAGPDAVDAGVGDDDRQAAPALDQLLDGLAHLGRVGDIGDQGHGLAAAAADLVGCLARPGLDDVKRRDACALLGQQQRRRAPDAGSCPRDKGDVPCDSHLGAPP